MNRDAAIKNLISVDRACRRHNVRAWLQDGTLLGLVRDGDLIPWDKDTDIGVMEGAWPYDLTRALQQERFVFTPRLKGKGPLKFRRDGVLTDVFVYREEAGGVISHCAFKNARDEYRFDYPKFRLAPFKAWGHTFWAPADPIAFLERKYGPQWRTPVRVWDFALDPKNGRRA